MLGQLSVEQVVSESYVGRLLGKASVVEFVLIYYWKVSNHEIWMLTVYGKNERETIAAHILRQIAKEIQDD